jgi:hypothetical protein
MEALMNDDTTAISYLHKWDELLSGRLAEQDVRSSVCTSPPYAPTIATFGSDEEPLGGGTWDMPIPGGTMHCTTKSEAWASLAQRFRREVRLDRTEGMGC